MGIDNLHLTFSRSEANEDVVKNILKQGINVAVVFDEVPNEYLGFKVIDGDDSDLTFTYESGVVVGLKFKRSIAKGANNKQIGNNFIVRYKQVA